MDCTGCELCVHACPDNALTSTPAASMLAQETPNWDYFLQLPSRWVLRCAATALRQAGVGGYRRAER